MKKNSEITKRERIKQDFLDWFKSLSEYDKERFQIAFGKVDLSAYPKPLDTLSNTAYNGSIGQSGIA